MKLLNKILGINLPTVEDIKQNAEAELKNEQKAKILGYVNFILCNDGSINVKTEWAEENDVMAEIYAQMLYQINSGALEEGILAFLSKFGTQNIKSQVFLNKVVEKWGGLRTKYKNLPLIMPSQVLSISKNSIENKDI